MILHAGRRDTYILVREDLPERVLDLTLIGPAAINVPHGLITISFPTCLSPMQGRSTA